MSEKEWICLSCLKTTNQVVRLKLFNMNLKEAIYMCTRADCVFPFTEGCNIFDYIVPSKLDINESDLIDSDDDGASGKSTVINSENGSSLNVNGVTLQKDIPGADAFRKKNKRERKGIPLVNHASEMLSDVSATCHAGRAKRLCTESFHSTETDLSEKDACSGSVVSEGENILADLCNPIGDITGAEFSDPDYEKDFTNLVSELAAYAESACDPTSNYDSNKISNTCENEIMPEKDSTCSLISAGSDGVISNGQEAESAPKNGTCSTLENYIVTPNFSELLELTCNVEEQCPINDGSQIYPNACPIPEKDNSCKIFNDLESEGKYVPAIVIPELQAAAENRNLKLNSEDGAMQLDNAQNYDEIEKSESALANMCDTASTSKNLEVLLDEKATSHSVHSQNSSGKEELLSTDDTMVCGVSGIHGEKEEVKSESSFLAVNNDAPSSSGKRKSRPSENRTGGGSVSHLPKRSARSRKSKNQDFVYY